MKKKVVRVILLILFLAVAVIGSYLITYFVDGLKKAGKEAIIEVIFDDNEYYVIPNSEVLEKEKALLEWPYKFVVKNTGNAKGLYKIIILDDEENDLKRDNLSYSLYLGDKELVSGKLSALKNDILYENGINKNEEQNYQLYIYKDSEDEGKIYKYSIHLDAILEGGPGF